MNFTLEQKKKFALLTYLSITAIFLNIDIGEHFHAKFKFEHFTILFLLSFLLIVGISKHALKNLKNSTIIFSGICLTLFLLPVISSENYAVSIIGFIKYLYILLFFIIGFLMIQFKIKINNLVLLIFILSILQACLGLYQYIMNEGTVWLNPNVIRPSGTLDNYLANYLIVGLLSGLTLLLHRNHTIVAILGLPLILSVLFFINSRISYIFTIWIVLIFIFYNGREINILKKIALVIFLSIFTINVAYLVKDFYSSERSSKIIPERSTNTAFVRFELWENALKMSAHAPFGVGYKMFGIELHNMAKENNQLSVLLQTFQLGTNIDAHSFFFTFLAETGILLTLIFFVPIIFIWIKTLTLQHNNKISLRFIKLWVLSGGPLLIIYDPLGMNIFWIALGAASHLTMYFKKEINEKSINT